MKKNITINMFGTLYAIDEDACNLLQEYLDSMKRYFQSRDGGDEIADDIEHHVAELLWAKKEQGIQAISIDDIRDIITQIGDARQIDSSSDEEPTEGNADNGQPSDDNGDRSDNGSGDADSNGNGNGSNANGSNNSDDEEAKPLFQQMKENMSHRRLYRDTGNSLLGGVLSGLSVFTGSGSPLLWRLSYIILFVLSLGPGLGWLFLPLLIGYVVMWIIVPTPRTVEDRLRMQGIEVTPENINQQILNDSAATQGTAYNSQSSNGGCLSLLLKFILLLLLLPFIFAGGAVIFSLFVAITAMAGVGASFFPFIFDDMHLGVATLLQDNWLFYLLGIIALLLTITLPIYWLARFILHHNDPDKKTYSLQLLIVWLVSVALGIAALTSFFMNVADIERNYQKEWRMQRNISVNGANINSSSRQVDANLVAAADSLASLTDSLDRISSKADIKVNVDSNGVKMTIERK